MTYGWDEQGHDGNAGSDERDDEDESPEARRRTFIAVHAMHPFEALAEPARRRIVDVLASGEHTAGQLAEVVGGEFRISRTAVSKHLRLLRDAGFVDVRSEYQWRWYRLTSKGLDVLELLVAELREKWDQRIGWDAELKQKRDPLASFRSTVARKGPGRPIARGHRGRQSAAPIASDPDDVR
ncbi:metalloregulator ArsR/SmtB family transcription factor [Microbacterium sp. 1P10UB]|uniref:ArsR/SmtB family transcription factor n=1 Tax=unclassified Microbacterium TaxID=2609290 RepID=UPI0039A2C25E